MKEKEINYRVLFEGIFWLSLLYVLRKAAKVSMFLTKYYPFSLIGNHLFYHHRNRKIVYLREYLFDASRKYNLLPDLSLCDEDQYFVHFWATFDGRTSQKKIQEICKAFLIHFGSSHAYVGKEKSHTYHFKVAVEKVD